MSEQKPELVGLADAVAELPSGWWWSGGVCGLTCHASIGPDFQGASPEMLAAFDDGFHADNAQPTTLAAAIMDCIAQAKESIRTLPPVPA